MSNNNLIPYFYKVHCDNPRLELSSCPYYETKDCVMTCYIAKNKTLEAIAQNTENPRKITKINVKPTAQNE